MQCYSGYQGEITIVGAKISNPIITPSLRKAVENYYGRKYTGSYETVISAEVVPQGEKDTPGKLIVKTQVNWDAEWKTVGIYTYTYQGMNFALIDLGIITWDPRKWF